MPRRFAAFALAAALLAVSGAKDTPDRHLTVIEPVTLGHVRAVDDVGPSSSPPAADADAGLDPSGVVGPQPAPDIEKASRAVEDFFVAIDVTSLTPPPPPPPDDPPPEPEAAAPSEPEPEQPPAPARARRATRAATTAPVSAAAPAAASTGAVAAAEERRLTDLVNGARHAAGLGPLAVTSDAVAVARAWSSQQVALGRAAHNPGLATALGGWSTLGENVGVGGSIDQLHQMFMDSLGHRANVVGVVYTQVGVGVVTSGGRLFVTVVFVAR